MENRELAELAKIRDRLAARAALDETDRARQRVLVRQYIADGATWDEAQRLAGISRTTLRNTLQRTD